MEQQEPEATAEEVRQTLSYYDRANETGELLSVLLQGLGTPYHGIAIIGAKMVSLGLTLLTKEDPDAAIELRDELASGFLAMIERLGIGPQDPESPNGKKAN